MSTTTCILTEDEIAVICHEANRALCITHDDYSQVSWCEAPEWQRDSAINGVKFRLDNPQTKQSASHENWMKLKISHGWVYGETKDEVKKTHPCLLPFEQLPPQQQAKGHLFCAIVDSLAPFAKTK